MHSNPDDTLSHVCCVLMVLCQLNFEEDTPGEPGDFNLGMFDLFCLLHNTLKMHETHDGHLPDGVVLDQADWQRDLERRAAS